MERTVDSFANFEARVGIQTDNQSSSSSYIFNPLTRNRMLLEWMYRGSWAARQVVDAVADDMTRAGIVMHSELDPKPIERLHSAWTRLQIWPQLNLALKWSRLYGGSVAVMMIDGQDVSTELRVNSIGKGAFKGLVVLDRWMVSPSSATVKELGPNIGKPEFYIVNSQAPALSGQIIHHSRCIRFEGLDLPFYQRQSENGWGLSVIEPMYDRMVAFDSATQGMAQLVYKAHLRTMKVKNYRQNVATGGPTMEAIARYMENIRRFQTNEGMTVVDQEDDFQIDTYAFGGLSDVINQLGQQLCGAAKMPSVRLFGTSPTGMNATGESDFRLYYDNCNADQERTMRPGCATMLDVTSRSEIGDSLPEGFNFSFAPLWQTSDKEKSDIGKSITETVIEAVESNLLSRSTALQELRGWSKVTGLWTNITDEEIEDAENDPPPGEALKTQSLIEVPGEEQQKGQRIAAGDESGGNGEAEGGGVGEA